MKIGKSLSEFWYNALKKIFFNDIYKKIEENSDATIRLTEFTNQFETILETADKISKISRENKTSFEKFQILIKQYKQLHIDLSNKIEIENGNQRAKFLRQLTHYHKEKNIEHFEKINKQNSTFLEQISIILQKQNSPIIIQNSQIIKEIHAQLVKNYDTINEKFEKLERYQFMVTFRENMNTVYTTLSILEKFDSSQIKSYHHMYLKYQKSHPKIPFLDLVDGVLIVKILFPSFFTEMLNNLSHIQNQLDDKTLSEMKFTLKICNDFFQNRNKPNLKKIKTEINSHISEIDKLILKLFDTKLPL